MELLRQYGTQTTVYFPLLAFTGDLKTSATLASGDFKLIKDGGASANATNSVTDEGNGMYSLVITATEMQAAVICLICADQTATKDWKDTVMLIATYGNASAQHAFDLDSATVTLADDGITAAKIAAGAIGSSEIADGAITAAKIATDAIDADALAADAVTEIQNGLATAAALSTVAGYLDTEIAAILAAVDTEVAAILAAVDTEVGAIKAVTDTLTLTAIADAVLSRGVSNVEGSASFRSLAGAVAKLVNKVQIDGSTLRIKKTDDSTDFGTQTMTTDASSDPIVTLDTD